MSQSISIPPLIPLPADSETRNTARDDNEDIFATLFSPATPRGSPNLRPVPDEPVRPVRHNRNASVDSEFGSFVSVPSTEDPLHQLAQDPTPFTPVQNFEFFDQFTENAKAATERNKMGVLDELLQNEMDPASFLRAAPQDARDRGPSLLDLSSDFIAEPSANSTTPTIPLSRAATPSQGGLFIPSHNAAPMLPQRREPSAHPPALISSPSPAPSIPNPSHDLLDELMDHENDLTQHIEQSAHTALIATNDASLLDLDPLEDEHLERRSRHPTRRSNWTEASAGVGLEHSPEHARSPSLPPSPTRISAPEVQRTQSFFAPSSLVSSSFTSRWMSSLLSRPAPPPPKTPEYDVPPSTHGRAATMPGSSITHGTPFGTQPYVPPSGAPGFTGDRTWDKGFQFDKENVERASVRLAGRKEVTVGVLTVGVADKLRPYLPALKRLARSWSLLYSLDQHGISLNTLYARCEAHMGGALLVMRDAGDAVFGVWMGEGVKLSKGSYYGSGESFLFRVLADGTLRVYKWTGKNDYVALCETDYISFGGGDGHYGLYLDDTLSDGSSARCPTFENDPLCSAGPRQGENVTFECVGLEVWGVG